MTEPTWKEAIIEVLKEAGEALHYTEIAEQIATRGLRTNLGVTPAQTVNAQIGRNGALFLRTGRGTYMLNTADPEVPNSVAARHEAMTESRAIGEMTGDAAEETEAAPVLKSIGIFWNRLDRAAETPWPAAVRQCNGRFFRTDWRICPL
ncbi:winged helix-turn-helix domain-containing protein [Paenirhodobacter sp.]|uniref:winged helix-turn-helix domain-containing protein n=1 Tax=Paenirhodobacter sp. TaxID=1965326 RepID=UPI003B408DBA